MQTVRRQVFQAASRVGAISPGPVITSLLADWPADKLERARDGQPDQAREVAEDRAVHALPDRAA